MTLRRATFLAAWLTTAALTVSQAPAWAQTGAPAADKPAVQPDAKTEEPDTLILSDTLHYDDAKRESVFTGNVIMTRGLMKLTSDKLVMHEDANGFQYGTATMNSKSGLVNIRQENPEKYEVVEAQGLRADYDGKQETLTMTGQAVITRYICGKPFDNIKGERVIYHQKTDTYEAFSGPQSAAAGGRVRSLAQPRSKTDAALAECQKKSASTR